MAYVEWLIKWHGIIVINGWQRRKLSAK